MANDRGSGRRKAVARYASQQRNAEPVTVTADRKGGARGVLDRVRRHTAKRYGEQRTGNIVKANAVRNVAQESVAAEGAAHSCV